MKALIFIASLFAAFEIHGANTEDSGNNEVVEVLYREVGRTEKPDYSTDCSLIPSTATYIKLVMGNVIDYYRPIAGKTFCEMLLSNKLHQWSSDGENWVTPAYTSLDHLGGSEIDWPSDGRKYLSFWGSNIQKGGCCITEYEYDGRSWMLEFSLYYVSGINLPVIIECAGKQCGDACSEGICDGNGGCVSPDYNPCAVHGCDGKKCGENCLAGDIMGICNKDGDCKIDTNSVICDGLEEGEACGCDMTNNCLGECKPGLECIIEGLGHGTCTKSEKPEPPTKPITCDYGQYCALVDCTKTGAADLCPDQCSSSETCNDGEKNQGETGRDCGGPCPACEYYEGEDRKVCNNEDDVIRTKEECKEALSKLAKQMNIHKHTYWEGKKKNIPAGCSIRLQNKRLHFNTQPGFGKGRKGQIPICRGKCIDSVICIVS